MIDRMNDIKMINATKRDDSIDVLRGICILYMIMGHIGFGSPFSKYIHAFHVPIFFVISGYFFREEEISQHIKSRFRTLIVPYIVFGAFHLFVYWAIEGVTFQELVIGSDSMLFHLLFMNSFPLPIAGALWFLVALFFCDLLFLMIQRIVKSGKIRHVIIILLSALGLFWTKLFSFRLPECLDIVLANLLIYDCGYCLRKNLKNSTINRILNLRLIETIIFFIISALLIMISPTINVKQGLFGNGILFLLNVMFAFIVYVNLSKWLLKVAPAWGWINRFLCYVGRNSMIYLCFNQLMIKLLRMLIDASALDLNTGIAKGSMNFIIFLVSTALLTWLSVLFQKSQILKSILGRKSD